MHANPVLCSRELRSRSGKFNKWMPEMTTVKQCANQMQMDSDMQTHSDLMTHNVGSTQSALIVVCETLAVR